MKFIKKWLNKDWDSGYDKGVAVGYSLGHQLGQIEGRNQSMRGVQFEKVKPSKLNMELESILEEQGF